MINLINQYFRKIKAFNKLFIIYATMMITALLLISTIVSYSLTSMVLKREIKYNHLILSGVKTYLEDNYKTPYDKTKTISSISNQPTLKKEELTRIIKQNFEMTYGSILIVKNNGTVIYDSSNLYYDRKYPINNYKEGSSTYKINNKEYIVSVLKSNATTSRIVGILPVDIVMNDMQGTKSTIFLVALLFISIGIFLTYYSKSEYQRRVQLITDAMKKVHLGDLSERIPNSNYEDEISEITEGFNAMCDSLEKYIDKVYISDIKQKKAELLALQAQINPHFLYNTLEVIRMSAALNGAEEAGDMIQILAKLFRNVVRMDTIITVDDEIRHSKLYLELFKIKYGDTLNVSFDIDPDILNLCMIKHLIQPAIENYIVHGFDPSRSNNGINIKGYRDSHHIIFTISDNGQGIDSNTLATLNIELTNNDYRNKDRIGLLNVNDRIKLIYDETCGIEITSTPQEGTLVKIKILAKNRRELEEYVQGIIS